MQEGEKDIKGEPADEIEESDESKPARKVITEDSDALKALNLDAYDEEDGTFFS